MKLKPCESCGHTIFYSIRAVSGYIVLKQNTNGQEVVDEEKYSNIQLSSRKNYWFCEKCHKNTGFIS